MWKTKTLFSWKTVAAAAILFSPTPSLAQQGSSFFEPFDRLDSGRWFISHGWSNGDWMNCTWSRDAVSVSDGRLILEYLPAPNNGPGYICGEVQTRAIFGYGTYEVSMRTMRGSGYNGAFFTYIGEVHGRPHHEIDVEVLLRNTNEVTFNTFVDGDPINDGVAEVVPRADEAFQHYAFTWDEDGVRWFVNGQQVHETAEGTPLPTESQKIYASLWGSETFTNWMGPFDPSAAPMHMEIDWIGFTREGESCTFPESILC